MRIKRGTPACTRRKELESDSHREKKASLITANSQNLLNILVILYHTAIAYGVASTYYVEESDK